VFYYDKAYYKELISYSGWNLFGNIAAIARGQGSNILLNLFFGPVANAAYSLTMMVQGIIGNFISNFQTALNPQITKSYAKGDISQSLHLMFKSSKFSYFAMLILVTPILFNLGYLMSLWLGKVPPYTISFIRLALICSLVETISNPLMTIAQATGKIKWYQIVIGSLIFLSLPVTWLVFKITDNPINFFWVLLGNSLMAFVFRLLFLNKMLGKMIRQFIIQVMVPIILVSGMVSILYFFANKFTKAEILLDVVAQTAIVLIPLVGIIYIIGLDKNEKLFINNSIKKVLKLN
jgi:O-antigen/teichoic acid export membrane protein